MKFIVLALCLGMQMGSVYADKAVGAPAERVKVFVAQEYDLWESHWSINLDACKTVSDIKKAYLAQELITEKYAIQGSWQLYPLSKIPTAITAADMWEVVHQRIENSEVMIARIGRRPFNVILQIIYAIRKGNIAVYIFPEERIPEEELVYLAYIFKISKKTQGLWKQKHFEDLEDLIPIKGMSVEKYQEYVEALSVGKKYDGFLKFLIK